MLLGNMSTNFFVNSGNVKVNTHLRLQQLNTLDITHPPDLCVITVVNSFMKSMCWRHILMFTLKKGYACTYPKCDRIYKSPAEYNKHLKKHCSSRPPSKCSVCDRSFEEKKYLDEHMKIHSDELIKECPHCGKKYRWRSSVLIHIRMKHPNLAKKKDK